MPPGISSWVVEGWDSAVLQITGSSWGLPHSPAYPLYTILANLFVRWLNFVPGLWDTAIVWRVTLWSTTTSLLSLLFLYFIVWKLTHDRVAAVVSSAILGVSFMFWRGAIMAEVYSLNAFIFVLTYWLALTWLKQPTRPHLILLGLTVGAGLVHHRTAVGLWPAVALGVMWLTVKNSPPTKAGLKMMNRLAILIVTALIPWLTYTYLPWAAINRVGQTWLYADASDWNTFWFMVLSREWWGLLQPPTTFEAWLVALTTLWQQQADQITPGGVVMGLGGLLLAYRYWWLFWPPVVMLIFFGTSYQVADLDSMLIPLTLTLCIGLGYLIGSVTQVIARWSILYIRIKDVKRKLVRQTVRLLVSGLVLFGSYLVYAPLAETNYAQVDLSGDWQAQDLVEEVVAIAANGTPLTIIGQDNSVLPDFIYARMLAGEIIEPLSTTTLSRLPATESQQLLQSRLAQGHRILIDRETVDLGFIPWLTEAVQSGRLFLAPTGHPYLWELLRRPMSPELPSYEARLDLSGYQFLEGKVSIVAAHQRIVHKRTGCFLRLTLFWQIHFPLTTDYYVAVQPLGGDAVIDKNDHLALMRGYLPTSNIYPGEIIRDEVDLLIRQPTALPLVSLVVNLYQVRGDQFPTFGEVILPITVDPAQCSP